MGEITTLDAVDYLHQHLAQSVLFSDPDKPNGTMTKGNRLDGSTKEDVVLNAITLTHGKIQEGIININLFAPNLKLPTDPVDNSQANWKRLKRLAKLATEAIGEVYSDNHNFRVQQTVGPLEDKGNQHYVNIRVEFISVTTI